MPIYEDIARQREIERIERIRKLQAEQDRLEAIEGLLGTPKQTQLMPQEGPVRPGEFLPPIQQTTQGSGLLGGGSPQEFYAGLMQAPGMEKEGLAGLQSTSPQPVMPFAKINPKDYTRESVSEFSQTGNYASLEPRGDVSPAKLAEKQFKNAKVLRGEFTQATKNYADINDSYGRIKVSSSDPSPAGDLSLIFNYMKMLDPESVVRESEFATAAATGSYGDRIAALTNKIMSGQKLSAKQRADFVNRANRLYKESTRIHSGRVKEFSTKAKQFNVDPSAVIFERQFHKDRTVKRSGLHKGRKVIEYTDGSIEYAD